MFQLLYFLFLLFYYFDFLVFKIYFSGYLMDVSRVQCVDIHFVVTV